LGSIINSQLAEKKGGGIKRKMIYFWGKLPGMQVFPGEGRKGGDGGRGGNLKLKGKKGRGDPKGRSRWWRGQGEKKVCGLDHVSGEWDAEGGRRKPVETARSKKHCPTAGSPGGVW